LLLACDYFRKKVDMIPPSKSAKNAASNFLLFLKEKKATKEGGGPLLGFTSNACETIE